MGQQLKAWINGLLTMREYKLLSNQHQLSQGAFAERIASPTDYNKQYDAESYFAFCRILKYKKALTYHINSDDLIWSAIEVVIEGLDEYYIQYTDDDNAHWIVQSWHDRWIQFNHFINYFMINLMKDKLQNVISPKLENVSRCHLVEAMVDTLHAIKLSIDSSQYQQQKNDSLILFRDVLIALIPKRFEYISTKQLFADEVDFYFESRFDGAFVGDVDAQKIRIDSVHCLCALMKIDLFYYQAQKDENLDMLDFDYFFGLFDIWLLVLLLSKATNEKK